MKNTYYALRHGKSLANVQGLIISDPQYALHEYGLVEEGRKQVTEAVTKAKHEGVFDASVVIFSSDFLRTKETAAIAADILGVGDQSIVFTPKLRERHFGAWEKTTNANYQKVWSDDAVNHMHMNQDVESVADILKRTISLIEDIESQYFSRNIILVSHGDTLQILQTFFVSRHPSQHRSLVPLETGSIRKLT